MNNKEECKIVKDLAATYLEQMASPESIKFVNNHLSECENCKRYYNDMSSDVFKENRKEKQNDEIEFNHLRKVGNKIKKLKISLMLLLIIIITVLSIVLIKYYKLSKIIDNSYHKLEAIKNLDNYILTQSTIYKDLKENTSFEDTVITYYKDGKYKVDSGNNINYYKDNSYNKICIYKDLKSIEYYNQDFIELKKGKSFNVFSEITRLKQIETGFARINLSLKEERFNGIDCYILRMGNENHHRDTWIDKKNFLTVRVIDEEYQDFYREVRYTLLENKVKDNDVDTSVLDSESFKDYERKNIENNNVLKEIKEYYK